MRRGGARGRHTCAEKAGSRLLEGGMMEHDVRRFLGEDRGSPFTTVAREVNPALTSTEHRTSLMSQNTLCLSHFPVSH